MLTLVNLGSCQFPTLGFVVDRYFRVKNFKPETFWSIKVSHVRDDVTVNFLWRRVHLFDRAAVIVLFERCLDAKTAKVTKVQKKPTKKWRPLPLTTVDLQMMGSRYLRMDSNAVMKVFILSMACLSISKIYLQRWRRRSTLKASSATPARKRTSSTGESI